MTPKLRQEAVENYRSEALNKMPPKQREPLLEAMAKEKEQMSHVFLGYNQIMRELRKGEVAALLVNKSATPELLPMSFIPACSAKGIPVVALENLDKLWRKCIAVGFKKSVKSPECCFHPLYEKMVQVTKKAARISEKASDAEDRSENAKDKSEETSEIDDVSDDDSIVQSPVLTKHDLLLLEEKKLPPSAVQLNKSPSKGSSGRRKRPPPPVIDVSRYHLTRTRTDQRAFIPGVGWNKMADMEDQELIMVSTDVAGVESENTSAGFDYRVTKKKRGYIGKKPYRGQEKEAPISATLGENSTGEPDSSAVHQNVPDDVTESHSEPNVPDLEKKSSDVMFQLDFDGDECSPQTDTDSAEQVSSVTLPDPVDPRKNTVKRKRSKLEKGSSYVPASVMRIVANAKRKKE